MTLNENDLCLVLNKLCEVRGKWYYIGLQLRDVPIGTLNALKQSAADAMDGLTQTLECWLKSDLAARWETLIDVLRTPSVGEKRLAYCLEVEYVYRGENAAVLDKGSFNLKQQLQHLLISEEKEQCTVELFQRVMKVFHNYELQVSLGKKDPSEGSEAMKWLLQTSSASHHNAVTLTKAFTLYLAIVRTINETPDCYGDFAEEFVTGCIEMMEGLEASVIKDTLFGVLKGEDFVIEPLAQVRSGFLLLDKACSGILQKRANMSDAREAGGMLSTSFIYPAMFWTFLTLRVRAGQHPLKSDYGLWQMHFLKEPNLIPLTEVAVEEVKRGLELGKTLELPMFNALLMAKLLIPLPDTSLRQFTHLRNAITKLAPYISVKQADFPFNQLLEIHQQWATTKRKEYINAMSNDSGLYVAIQHGLEFLDTMVHVLTQASENQFQEICQAWLSLLLSLILTEQNAVPYLMEFFQSQCVVVKDYHTFLKQEVAEQMKPLPVVQFLPIYQGLHLWNQSLLKEYLLSYNFKGCEGAIISQDLQTWEELLSLTVKGFPGNSHHSLIIEFFTKLEVYYHEEGITRSLVVDLMRLKVAGLFEGKTSNVFQQLQVLLRNHHSLESLQGSIKRILNEIPSSQDSGTNLQRQILWEVLVSEVISDLKCLHGGLSCPAHGTIDVAVEILCETPLEVNFYKILSWKIIARCCAQLHVSTAKPESLFILSLCHYAVEKIANVHERYYSIASELSDELSKEPAYQEYISWTHNIAYALSKWKDRLQEESISYDEIRQLLHWHAGIIHDVACKFSPNEEVPTKAAVKDAEVHYREQVLYLSNYLLPHFKTGSHPVWCSLPTLMMQHGVQLPENLQQKIAAHVMLPEESDKSQSNFGGAQISFSEEEFYLARYKLGIILGRDVTLLLLRTLVRELEEFLDPLLSYVSVLVASTSSKMVKKYLDFERSKIIEGSPVIMLKKALIETEKRIRRIAEGAADYREVSAEGNLDLKNLDLETEFDVLRCICPGDTFVEITMIKNMLELLQMCEYTEHIQEVCKQYHLEDCSADCDLKDLLLIADETTKEQTTVLTIRKASQLWERARQLLQLKSHRGIKCLTLFPRIVHSAQFYQFISHKFFGDVVTDLGLQLKEAHHSFHQQYDFVIRQFQDNNFAQQVLPHVKVSFQYIMVFFDRNHTFSSLMSEVNRLDNTTGFAELQTVSTHLGHIRAWFAITEDDTWGSIYSQLQIIENTGMYILDPSGSVSFSQSSRQSNEMVLQYMPTVESHSTLIWHNKEIDDFLQKLGLVETNVEGQERVSHFLHLSEMAYKLLDVNANLRELGNLDDIIPELPCSITSERAQEILSNAENTLKRTKEDISQFQQSHPWLLFFSNVHILKLAGEVEKKDFDAVVQEVSFLFQNTPLAHSELEETVKRVLLSETLIKTLMLKRSAVETVGLLLTHLYESEMKHLAIHHSRPCLKQVNKRAYIHTGLGYSQDKLIRLTLQVFNGIPDPLSMLHCHAMTTEGDLRTFMERAQKYPHDYMVLEVNLLSYHLQEVLLKLHWESTKMNSSTIHFVETSPSLFSEMPWIQREDHKSDGPSMSFGDAQMLYAGEVARHDCPLFLKVELVYGHPGVGKTFYIRQQLKKNPESSSISIALNEAFNRSSAIQKLNKLPKERRDCAIFFNFTMGPPPNNDVPKDEADAYFKLLDDIGWFFYEMLVLGYVQSHTTGESFQSFHFPAGLAWTIFVEASPIQTLDYDRKVEVQKKAKSMISRGSRLLEADFNMAHSLSSTNYVFVVPSQPCGENPDVMLKHFSKTIPAVALVGQEHLVDRTVPYYIDNDVRLVCSYLKAYRNGEINTLHIPGSSVKSISLEPTWADKRCEKELKKLNIPQHNAMGIFDNIIAAFRSQELKRIFITGDKISFKPSEDRPMPDDECRQILNLEMEMMPEYMKQNKIAQKLFIKYMKRRCTFMENFHGFCYNCGSGERIEGESFTNTVLLGSTLMETMLSEVREFCDPRNKHDWTKKAHQQLIYDTRDGGESIGLISLKPERLTSHDIDKFRRIGIEVVLPSIMTSRLFLDDALSRALNVPLDFYEEGYQGRQYTLSVVDEQNYVLTLDYALKMLNIHERLHCGIPVIIEGETGVGKTALVEMLSKLWDCSVVAEWNRTKSHIQLCIQSYLKDKQKEGGDYIQFKHAIEMVASYPENLAHQSIILNIPSHHKCFDTVLWPKLMALKGSAVLSALEISVHEPHVPLQLQSSSDAEILNSLFIAAEDKDLKAVCTLYSVLFGSKVKSRVHKLSIHAALKPEDVKKFFSDVQKQAHDVAKSIASVDQEQRPVTLPYVTVYLDEINTSSCLGLFKEIIIDRAIDGEPIPDNVFIIASCNPHRGNSLAHRVVVTHYYVRQLHPTLELLKWDYGSLDKCQERDYINQKLTMFVNEMMCIAKMDKSQSDCLTSLIAFSQTEMRRYAKEQLLREGVDKEDAAIQMQSCVSQRDIQRVFTFCKWFLETYIKLNRHPENCYYRAILVALGLVYYLRLNTTYREIYKCSMNSLANTCFSPISFSEAFESELNWYTNEVELPPGIAKIGALKENLFTIITCCETQTPLIIEGPSGCSKTLSFNVAVANLKGEESIRPLFRKDIFPCLEPHFYQCSRSTTSKEIEQVFDRALYSQTSQPRGLPPTCFVVFMDEAGLPEKELESLKVLHHYLDKPKLSFVAVTNDPLDAAKTNRAVNVYHSETSETDLITLARECLSSHESGYSGSHDRKLKAVCSAYKSLMQKQKKQQQEFFGLRDLIYFLIYLRRKHKGRLEPYTVLKALERNFNGTDRFLHICQEFLSRFESNSWWSKLQTTQSILRDSLKDLSYSPIMGNIMSVQSEVRYKLIIDPSEDESLVRLLFTFNVLKKDETSIQVCSSFPGDKHLEVRTISEIRHAALRGDTTLLFQTDRIQDSLYDLFNQRFQCFKDYRHGTTYYANIAIGAYSKPCRVDPKFQCLVVVNGAAFKNATAAFLTRFEKYHLSYRSMWEEACSQRPYYFHLILNAVYMRVNTFVKQFGSSAFYGLHEDTTAYSLMITSLLPSSDGINSASVDVVHSKKVALLYTLLQSLREKFHFNIPKMSSDEMKLDASSIFDVLEEHKDFKYAVPIEETIVETDIEEAMAILMSDEDPMRQACKRLMHLMTPEAFIVHQERMPSVYIENYLRFQQHFSLKDLITKHISSLQKIGDVSLSATKFLCFTRSSMLIDSLPPEHPSPLPCDADLKALIYDDPEQLMIYKLSSNTSRSKLKILLDTFMNSNFDVFVFVVRFPETTKDIINHLRIMIEVESRNKRRKCFSKLFVILLHFPPAMFFSACYPSYFLEDWEHYYLDSVAHGTSNRMGASSSVVDIKRWLEFCYLAPVSQMAVEYKLKDILLIESLIPESIPIIISRVNFSATDDVPFNRCMNGFERAEALNKLLVGKGVGKVLCDKFRRKWSREAMTEYTKKAASYAHDHGFSLNLTDSILTMLKAIFFEYLVYMISRINEHWNLDILFEDDCPHAVQSVFLDILAALPIPELSEISPSHNAAKVPQFQIPGQLYLSRFPFFKCIFQILEKLVDKCDEKLSSPPEISTDVHDPSSSGITDWKQVKEQMIHREALNNRSSFLEEWELTCLEASAARMEDKSDPVAELWLRYFKGFLHQELLPAIPEGDTSENVSIDLLKAYFKPLLEERDPLVRLISLHVHTRLHWMDLRRTRVMSILHTLNRLSLSNQPGSEVTESLPHVSLSRTSLVSSVVPAGPIIDSNNPYLSAYVTESMFNSLQKMLKPMHTSSQHEGLHWWYNSYLEIMSSVSLRRNMYSCLEEGQSADVAIEGKGAKFAIMQAIYLFFRCAPGSTNTQTLFNTLFTLNFTGTRMPKFKGLLPTLEQVAVTGAKALPTPCPVILLRRFVEGISDHYFSGYQVHSYADANWFLELANVPSSGMLAEDSFYASSDVFHHFISSGMYKCVLSRILWADSSTGNRSLLRSIPMRKEICTILGSLLAAQREPGPYIPQFFQVKGIKDILDLPSGLANSALQQPLAHLYYSVVMEKLQFESSKFDLTVLINHASKITHELSTIREDNNAGKNERALQFIEKEAIIHLMLMKLGDTEESLHETPSIDTLKDLLREHSTCAGLGLVLSLHLLKSSPMNSWCSLRELLNCNHQELACLKSMKKLLKNEMRDRTDQFLLTDEHRKLYEDICRVLHSIDCCVTGTTEFSKLVLQWCVHRNLKQDFMMILWLSIYDSFYDQNKTSPHLSAVIKGSLCDLVDESYIHLLECFLEDDEPSYTDPIRNLFYPTNQDDCDIYLRRALAYLVAAVLGSPPQSNHIWYHLFAAHELKDSYMTGLLNVGKVGTEIWYDQEVNISPEADCGTTGKITMSLWSFCCLMWANFGAFCMGLLTQPTAQESIGSILSPKCVRHYCSSQLLNVWKLMCNGLKLTVEERFLFVRQTCMELLSVCRHPTSPSKGGIFQSQGVLAAYEHDWECKIVSTRKQFLEHIDQTISEPLFKVLRLLETHYLLPDERDLRLALDDITGVYEQQSPLYVLARFVQEHHRLKLAGTLLPRLIDFYLWLHRDRAYTITYEESEKRCIFELVKEFEEKYADHKERITLIELYNQYSHAFRSVAVDSSSGDWITCINNETKLIHCVSTDESSGCFFVMIEDIISHHNGFLDEVIPIITTHPTLKHFVPKVLEINPATVAEDMCILHNHGSSEDTDSYLPLIRRRTLFPQTKEFDFHALQEDIITTYIAGKSKISDPAEIRTPFRFKQPVHLIVLPTDTVVNHLKDVEMELQSFSGFQHELDEEQIKRLEVQFHSASYSKMMQVETGLKTTTDHLIKVLQHSKERKVLSEMTFSSFLCHFVYNHLRPEQYEEVLKAIGITSLSAPELASLAEIKIPFLYGTLKVFVQWIMDGFYDFCELDIPLKRHLSPVNDWAIKDLCSKKGIHDVVRKFEREMLHHLGSHAMKILQACSKSEVSDLHKPLKKYLVDEHLLDDNKHAELLEGIPDSINIEHCVHFLIALRRYLHEATSKSIIPDHIARKDTWNETVQSLWTSDPDLQGLLYQAYLPSERFLYDPAEGRFLYDVPSTDEGKHRYTDEEKHKEHRSTDEGKHVEQYTVEDIATFLREIGMESYVPKFQEEEITGSDLLMPDEKLEKALEEDLGVVNPLHRLKIKKLFQRRLLDAHPQHPVHYVVEFLQSIPRFNQYVNSFEENAIDGELLLHASSEVLEVLGVHSELHKSQIPKRFKEYNEQTPL